MTDAVVAQTPASPIKPEEQNSKDLSAGKMRGARYFAALLFVAATSSIPVLAGVITIVLDSTPTNLPKVDNTLSLSNQLVKVLHWLGPNTMVLILGLFITFIVWLLLGIFFQPFATFEYGRFSDPEHIKKEFSTLNAQYRVLKEERDREKKHRSDQSIGSDSENGTVKDMALEEIKNQLHDIEEIMKRPGLLWVLSTGYINLWSRLHRVQEILLDLLPCQTIIDGAKNDDLRLFGSLIPNKDNLQVLIKNSISTLSSSTTTTSQDAKRRDQQAARSDLHKVRTALHKFTEERWEGLVLARNQIMLTAFVTGCFTYLLVAIAILSNVQQVIIIEGMVFYSLGIIVGLFGQLYNEWQSKDPVGDDYGLATARIIVTPLLSGLAAIVGVFLVVMLSITLITPQHSSSSTFPKLETIFAIDTYPQNLLYAAIFGFLPSLVIRLLQQRTDQVLSQIQSSSAGDHKSSDASAVQGNSGSNSTQSNATGSTSVQNSSSGGSS
jgi:hypothetical protein